MNQVKATYLLDAVGGLILLSGKPLDFQDEICLSAIFFLNIYKLFETLSNFARIHLENEFYQWKKLKSKS